MNKCVFLVPRLCGLKMILSILVSFVCVYIYMYRVCRKYFSKLVGLTDYGNNVLDGKRDILGTPCRVIDRLIRFYRVRGCICIREIRGKSNLFVYSVQSGREPYASWQCSNGYRVSRQPKRFFFCFFETFYLYLAYNYIYP